MTKYTIVLLMLVTGLTSSVEAQKMAYVNSGELLSGLEIVKNADKEIAALQKELLEAGQKMMTQFETNYKAYMEKANAGTLSKVQMAEEEQWLQKEQQELGMYEQEMKQKILQKRESLLTPILTKVDETIKAIGKENGYDFIFDSSLGMLLYMDKAEDLTAKVKAKL